MNALARVAAVPVLFAFAQSPQGILFKPSQFCLGPVQCFEATEVKHLVQAVTIGSCYDFRCERNVHARLRGRCQE